MAACNAHGSPAMVWSNRGLFKAETATVPVDEALFDLVIHPGELGSTPSESQLTGGGKRVLVPPVCLLEDDELLGRAAARKALGLALDGRYVLFSLGPGNLKDVTGIGHGLIRAFEARGFRAVWALAPISVRDGDLPAGVIPISVYPLARYLLAFDAFVGAAGYNTCCEVVQARIPSLLVPNTQLVDDQAKRARLVAKHAPAVVSACETTAEQEEAVTQVLKLIKALHAPTTPIALNGASLAADAILALTNRRGH
jgi:hypothetical protein